MALVIKKVVELSSLGDEYKGIEFIFRSIPSDDLAGIDKRREALPKGDDGEYKMVNILPFAIDILKTYFISGTQDEQKIDKEEVGLLDADSLIYCFQILTGQAPDPKVPSESTNTSTTESEQVQK